VKFAADLLLAEDGLHGILLRWGRRGGLGRLGGSGLQGGHYRG
jgi:hypothetical protein